MSVLQAQPRYKGRGLVRWTMFSTRLKDLQAIKDRAGIVDTAVRLEQRWEDQLCWGPDGFHLEQEHDLEGRVGGYAKTPKPNCVSYMRTEAYHPSGTLEQHIGSCNNM